MTQRDADTDRPDITSAFLEQIAFEGDLRLEWRALDAAPGVEAMIRMRDVNLTVLNLVAAVEEHRGGDARGEVGEDDSAGNAELARLDAKVNLLLELVQRLVAGDREPPARRNVRLNSLGVAIDLVAAEQVGAAALVEVCVHLDASRAMPLKLPATTHRLVDGRTLFAFNDLGPALSEALDRLVFRYHRRQVALERRSVRPRDAAL